MTQSDLPTHISLILPRSHVMPSSSPIYLLLCPSLLKSFVKTKKDRAGEDNSTDTAQLRARTGITSNKSIRSEDEQICAQRNCAAILCSRKNHDALNSLQSSHRPARPLDLANSNMSRGRPCG